ncbi:MAG: Uncharacterized protein XD63_0683 [Thermoanaerobacterales bacterium 50_218]|nr:MAG: Uncharacterized protein XD63_0683 [Thermoanaerobacterales bacterium 50_218]
MVEVTVIERKLKDLDRYLQQLSRYQGITGEELRHDLEKAWAVEHGLQLCIQILLDVGNHLLSEKGVFVSDYKSIFFELARLGVLPMDFAKRISGMAGFRNILVHAYGEVDLEKVAQMLSENLGDFRKFAEYLCTYLQEQEEDDEH